MSWSRPVSREPSRRSGGSRRAAAGMRAQGSSECTRHSVRPRRGRQTGRRRPQARWAAEAQVTADRAGARGSSCPDRRCQPHMCAHSVAQWGPALSHPVDCRLRWSIRQRLPWVGRTGWKGAGRLSQNDRSTLSALEWWLHGLFSCQTSSNWLQKICVEVTQRPQVHHKVILLSTNCETVRRWVKQELKIFPTRALLALLDPDPKCPRP